MNTNNNLDYLKDNPTNCLLIGFSFSLNKDGSPGSYNQKITSKIIEDINCIKCGNKGNPWIGIQWEIYDALNILKDNSDFDMSLFPSSHVAPPPSFKTDEIKLDKLKGLLSMSDEDDNSDLNILRENIEKIMKEVDENSSIKNLTNHNVASYFNRLLTEKKFFKDFYGKVVLKHLYRPERGPLAVEYRMMPDISEYNNGLRTYQTKRVNRLIIEAICGEIITTGEYLNTAGVLKLLLPKALAERPEISHIYIYAHPKHSHRCRRTLIEIAWELGFDVQFEYVYERCEGEEWKWESDTAQVWCRSEDNWNIYNKS